MNTNGLQQNFPYGFVYMFVFSPKHFLEITVLHGSKWTINCNYIPITDKMIVIEFIVFLCSYTFYVILSASLYMSHVITEGIKRALECKVATSVFEFSPIK